MLALLALHFAVGVVGPAWFIDNMVKVTVGVGVYTIGAVIVAVVNSIFV